MHCLVNCGSTIVYQDFAGNIVTWAFVTEVKLGNLSPTVSGKLGICFAEVDWEQNSVLQSWSGPRLPAHQARSRNRSCRAPDQHQGQPDVHGRRTGRNNFLHQSHCIYSCTAQLLEGPWHQIFKLELCIVLHSKVTKFEHIQHGRKFVFEFIFILRLNHSALLIMKLQHAQQMRHETEVTYSARLCVAFALCLVCCVRYSFIMNSYQPIQLSVPLSYTSMATLTGD